MKNSIEVFDNSGKTKTIEVLSIGQEVAVEPDLYEQSFTIVSDGFFGCGINGWFFIHPIYKCKVIIISEKSISSSQSEDIVIKFSKNRGAIIH